MKEKLEDEVLVRQSLGFWLVKLELMLDEWEHFKVEDDGLCGVPMFNLKVLPL